jgi:hypothetical protein
MHVGQRLFAALFVSSLLIVGLAAGCGSNKSNGGLGPDGDDASSGAFGSGSSGSSGGSTSSGDFSSGSLVGDAATCQGGVGWACQVAPGCDGSSNTPTTLTGKVFDPAGANPLYNVIVFIPNIVSELPVITPGTKTCDSCDVRIGDYVVATTTDANGEFTLQGVPNGTDVPVTVQIGKWRRTTTVNIAKSCAANSVADGTLRLPRKRSEGDMPQMAVLTGGCDDMGCFLTGIGIDPTEFDAPGGGARLDVYQGSGLGGFGGAATLSNGTAGNCTNSSCPLWQSKGSFEKYDLVLFSCECGENAQTKPTSALQALHDWLDEGGKVFASHYHYYWFEDSPDADFKGVANWGNTGNNDIANSMGGTYDIDTSFPKGATFGQWLKNVNALSANGPPPQIKLSPVADSVKTVNPPTSRWVYDSANPNDVKYMSFGTPVGGFTPPDAGPETPKAYCGKAVLTDLHTGGSLLSTVSSIPSGCGNNSGKLSAQQKALEFLFFDLSACVQDDSQPVVTIPPPK